MQLNVSRFLFEGGEMPSNKFKPLYSLYPKETSTKGHA
jgi:hypothetical protein